MHGGSGVEPRLGRRALSRTIIILIILSNHTMVLLFINLFLSSMLSLMFCNKKQIIDRYVLLYNNNYKIFWEFWGNPGAILSIPSGLYIFRRQNTSISTKLDETLVYMLYREKISTGKFTWQSSTFGQDKFFRRSYILFIKKLKTSSKKRKNVPDSFKQKKNNFFFLLPLIVHKNLIDWLWSFYARVLCELYLPIFRISY